MKKVLLLSSLAVSGVILAGCGSGESTGGVTLDTLLEESNKVMDSVKSVSTNINIDVEMDMSDSAGGNDTSFEIKMTGEGVLEAVLDNFAAHQVMNMNVSLYNVDQASSTETYMIADANNSKKVDVYTNSVSNDAEPGWLHTSIDMEDASQNLNSNLYNLYTNSKDSFSLEKKTKQFEGSECYVVNAKLGFKDIASYASEILSQLDVDENSDLKIDTVYYIDKETKEVKGAEVDMADTMKSLLEESAQQSSNTGIKINIKAFKVTSENTYNTVTSIDIPKEVTEAAKKAEEEKNSVPTEYKNALKQAETYSSKMHMSKQDIYDQLVSEYGGQFPADAAQYAIDNLDADYKQNALKQAENYSSKMHMSKQDIYDQLVSEYGGQFTPEEAQYAIDNLDADYKQNALKQAENYSLKMHMSKQDIYDQLVSEYGGQFTPEEAQYAIDNLN